MAFIDQGEVLRIFHFIKELCRVCCKELRAKYSCYFSNFAKNTRCLRQIPGLHFQSSYTFHAQSMRVAHEYDYLPRQGVPFFFTFNYSIISWWCWFIHVFISRYKICIVLALDHVNYRFFFFFNWANWIMHLFCEVLKCWYFQDMFVHTINHYQFHKPLMKFFFDTLH